MWMVIKSLEFNHSALDLVKKGSVYQYCFKYFPYFVWLPSRGCRRQKIFAMLTSMQPN